VSLASDFKIKLYRLLIGLVVLIAVSWLVDRVLFSHFAFPAILRFGLGCALLLIGVPLPAISGRQRRTPAFWPRCLFRWTMKHKFDCP